MAKDIPTDAVTDEAPAALTVAWSQPTDKTTPRPTPTPVLVLAWVGALVVLTIRAAAARLDGGSEAGQAGQLVGTIVGPILIALGIRWLWVRFGRSGPVVRSVWVPVIAALIALLTLGSALPA